MSVLSFLSVNLVDSVDEAQRFLSWLGERRPVLAVDTETTGIEWDADVRLVQFGDARTAWAVPVKDWRGVAVAGLSAVREQAGPVVLHNAQFDMHRLTNTGFPVPEWRTVEDTLVLSRLHEPDRPAGLKPLCSRLFGKEAVAGQDLLRDQMSKNRWTWATVPDTLPAYWQYGALDTSLTALAFEQLRPLVPSEVYDRELAVMSILFRAEQRGMAIDADYTSALLAEWQSEAAGLRAQLQEAGIENPSSNVQVAARLKQAGWEPEEFTDTGLPKLDKAVLSTLSEHYGDLAGPLLRYRRLVKWCSTYLETFLRDADGQGRVHPNMNILGARTGRMSITNPPLQTLPSGEASIRDCIMPYGDDEVLYAIDYDNMEMRVFASYAGDAALTEAAKSEDFHRTTAAFVFDKDPSDVTKEERSLAKTVNFANVYGAGPDKMAQQAGTDRPEIDGFLSRFNARFPGAQAFKDEVERQGKMRLALEGQAYITTSGGRRVPCEDDKPYVLVNYICQGGAADVFKSAIVALDAAGLGDYIVCPIHDELLFSFPKDEAAELANQAREAMEDHTTFAVPLTCGVDGPLTRWGEKYRD